jgi:hypothetical protein
MTAVTDRSYGPLEPSNDTIVEVEATTTATLARVCTADLYAHRVYKSSSVIKNPR